MSDDILDGRQIRNSGMREYTIDEAVEKRFNHLKGRPREDVDRILLEDIERIWRRCRDLEDRIQALESSEVQIRLDHWESGYKAGQECVLNPNTLFRGDEALKECGDRIFEDMAKVGKK